MVKPLSATTASMPNFYYKVNHIKKITKFRLKKKCNIYHFGQIYRFWTIFSNSLLVDYKIIYIFYLNKL